MGTADHFGTWPMEVEPQASLIGPVATEPGTAQVGLSEPTVEEKEKLLLLQGQQDPLNPHNEKESINMSDGKKVILDLGNVNLARDAETGVEMVRNHSGVWIKPGDTEYAALLSAVTSRSPALDSPDPTDPASADKKTTRHELENFVQTAIIQDEGSKDPHPFIDEAVQQKLRAGVSDIELRKLAGILAAVDGVAFAGTEEVNPEKLGSMHPDPVGPSAGEQQKYAEAQRQKDKRNEQFTAQLNARKRDGQA